jgi:hypothetical protein
LVQRKKITGPFEPAAPAWMCAMVTALLNGPVKSRVKSIWVRSALMVVVPEPEAWVATAGTSFAPLREVVNTVGRAAVPPPPPPPLEQPDRARSADDIHKMKSVENRFISISPSVNYLMP